MGKKALILANLIGFVDFLWNDIELLKEHGYEVYFAANGNIISEENHLEELKKREIQYFQVDFSSKKPFTRENLRAYQQIKKILKKENFDLVHCHTPIVGFITRIATIPYRKKGTKVIYTTHGLTFTHFSSKKQWLVYYNIEKIVSRFTDVIITINKEDFSNVKTMNCKDVRLINGVGVDTERYHNVKIDPVIYKQKIGIPTDKKIVLSVGELSERKNHQIIIKALGQLSNKKDFCYVICGREVSSLGFADMLQNLAIEQGVELILLGHRDDIPEIMHCSDIGAIPSVREGLGLAGIQSLCAGVPLIGTDVQGIREYIIPGKTGCLCEPFDVNAYADALVYLSDDNNRSEMKEYCYQVAKKFDIAVSRKQMSDIYTSVLERK